MGETTALLNRSQIKNLKFDIGESEDYLKTVNPKLIRKNRNRPPLTKFKGSSEEIYKEFSVVFIANFKKNGSGSGFIVNHNGLKIVTNWHVIDGAKNVKIWLKPKNLIDEDYMIELKTLITLELLRLINKKI